MPDIVAGVVGVVFIFVWVYCLFDVITTEESHIRHLPKIGWFLVVLLLADIGSILWLCFGRPRLPARGRASAGHAGSRPVGTSAPLFDDLALDHMHPIVREREERARLRMWEAQLMRRESEVQRRERGEGPVA
jgi:hypothetical protein